MRKLEMLVSVIVLVDNDADILEDFVKNLSQVLNHNYSNYEVLLIDNASTDNIQNTIQRILSNFDCVRYLRLSRLYDEEMLLSLGLDTVIGDFVVTINPNTDPPELIPEMIEKTQKNDGVLFAVSDNSEKSLFLRLATSLFHFYSEKFLNISIPKNFTGFAVLSRQAVNALLKLKDNHRYLRLINFYTGFNNERFQYKNLNPTNLKKRKSFLSQLKLAKNIVIISSMHPLRVVTWLAFFASFLNILYLFYIVAIYLIKDHVAEGWTISSFITTTMFFFLFLVLTVLSEYIGQILKEAQGNTFYAILNEKNSSVLLSDPNRTSIVKESK